MDRIIRGMTKDKSLRFKAIDATVTVQKAVDIHHLSMTNSVILGRMICGALMMANDLRSEQNILTLRLDGNGPAGAAIVTARKNGFVKGYIKNPELEFALNKKTGSFNIQKAIGKGTLTVSRDLGLKNPYVGQVELKYSTVAKDLTYYFVHSEQIPSPVGLGVMVQPDGSIKQAGGFIIQILPETPNEVISNLEANLARFPNLTDMMDMGYSIEDLIKKFILQDMPHEIKETTPVDYRCDCSKEKFKQGIKLLSRAELQEAIQTNETLKVHCHFCNTEYKFDRQKIETILAGM
ncbi:MAG: Hsp33 family molecular chaperone HslO [Candidatus Cloacimonetes bacterium]|nr:Hsp33 family molecular chaperone HslO [Candidatus Cloacimonadota bacterium]